MNCKDCKHFDNTKPVDTAHNVNDKYKNAEFYIGRCKKIGRIKMMNDTCGLYEEKTSDDNERVNDLYTEAEEISNNAGDTKEEE